MTKEMFEADYKKMLSIDIYNIMMANPKHKNYNTMSHVLKERNETGLLHSLLINKHS